MNEYPPKILLAFAESINPHSKVPFQKWLLENGYPELAALSSTIQGSQAAKLWLMKFKFFHFAAFDDAIDKKGNAHQWLIDNGHPLLAITADAANNEQTAINWLREHNQNIYLIIAHHISEYLSSQTLDPHKSPI